MAISREILRIIAASGGGAWITGTAGSGNVLTANLAASLGTASTWQWSRNGSPISGATSSTYTQVTADLGATVSVLVNGTYSASIAVPGIAPTVTSAPSVASATTTAGLTWTPGVYAGTPTPTVVANVLVNGTLVSSGVTQGSYTPVINGSTIQIQEVATNVAGSVASTSTGLTVTSASGVAVTITTQLDAARIIQRTSSTDGGQGKGQGSVAMALSFAGTQPVWCRRRSFSDSTTIVQAPWLANASATTGTITLTGIDAAAFDSSGNPAQAHDGWSYIDVGTSSVGPWTNATNQVGVGDLTMAFGQSLAVRVIGAQEQHGTVTNASLGITPSPYTSMLCTYNESRAYMPTVSTMPWAPPADGGNYDSTGASSYLNYLVKQLGVMCGLIGHSHGAQPLKVFLPGQTDGIQLASVVARAGGAWAADFWYQGHTDATYGTPPNGYATGLTQIYAYLATLNSFAGVKHYLGTIPNIDSNSWGTPYGRNQIRAGADAWATANSAVHVQINDISQVDGIHPDQAGAVVLMQHLSRARRAEQSLRGDLGPALLSATRVGTTITANLSDVGQGNLVLTGTPGDRIYVFPTGMVDTQGTTNNRFPVSSVSVVNRRTLSIVLANDPGDAHVLDLRLGWPNESTTTMAQTSMIRDDIVDGDGITVGRAVVPNYVPVVIAAPGSGATNAPPSGFIANTSRFSMTETSTTYSGSPEQAGFGNVLTGGYAAATSTNVIFYPLTLEFWFTYKAPAGNASGEAFFAGLANFVSISNNGKIVGIGGTNTLLTANHRYHVALIWDVTGHSMYMTDVTASGAGTRISNDTTTTSGASAAPTPTTWYIRNNNNSVNPTMTMSSATATVDEIAIFDIARYSGTTYTAPTVPFAANTPHMVAHYACDSDCKDSVCA